MRGSGRDGVRELARSVRRSILRRGGEWRMALLELSAVQRCGHRARACTRDSAAYPAPHGIQHRAVGCGRAEPDRTAWASIGLPEDCWNHRSTAHHVAPSGVATRPTMLRPAVLQHGPSRCNTAHSTAPRAAASRVSDDSGTAGEASETRPETCGGPPLFEQRPAEEDARAEAAAVRVLVECGTERVREVRV